MAKASTSGILKKLNSVDGYHPFSANTFSDWSVESGDIIKISRDGTEYKSPVNSSSLTWKGQSQVNVSSSGNKEREAIAVMSSKEYSSSSRSGNTYRSNAYRSSAESELESHIKESEKSLTIAVNDLEKKTATRFTQTDNRIGMSVGTLKYEKTITVEKYSDLANMKGNSKYLYYVKDTKSYYVYNEQTKTFLKATPSSDGEVNYVKVGEIAAAFNEQTGKVEATLDAHVIYAGKKSDGSLVTLEDLDLPDWMGATDEGIIALQINVGTLNAKVANIEKITAKAITTDNLDAKISNLSVVHVKSIQPASGTSNATLSLHSISALQRLYIGSGQTSVDLISGGVANAITDLDISLSANTYTLRKKTISNKNWTDVDTFSRATTLSGRWSSRKFTVTASPQGNSLYSTIVDHVLDLDFGSGYDATGTLKATIGDSETLVTVGNIYVNAYQAYQNGAGSVTPEHHTQSNDLYCSKATVIGSGNTDYTFTATLPSGRFSAGNTYTFWR